MAKKGKTKNEDKFPDKKHQKSTAREVGIGVGGPATAQSLRDLIDDEIKNRK